MKYWAQLLLFLTVSISTAQIEEQLSDFHTIKTYDLITVNLVKSNENKIIITGHDAQDVVFVQRKGVLKVRMKIEKSFDGDNTFVHVHYTDLNTIDANEGSFVVTNELVKQDQIELRVQEGATIRAGLDLGTLKSRAVTGGILELSGSTDYQDIVVNTGGIVEAQKLKSKHTTVRVKAGGEVEVYANESVDIDIKAGGDVTVFGNPSKVRKKTFAGGRIDIE